MFSRIIFFAVCSILLFSCATTSRHIASKENFHKDQITKQAVSALQYYFSADNPLVLKRVHLASKTVEKGVLYHEISDSVFTLKPGTPGVLSYVYRDSAGYDMFYVSFEDEFSPIPFAAKNTQKEFRVYVEGQIQMDSGRWLPAVFLRDLEGQLKEVWVVQSLAKNNRLMYEVGYKKKTTKIQARGKKIEE